MRLGSLKEECYLLFYELLNVLVCLYVFVQVLDLETVCALYKGCVFVDDLHRELDNFAFNPINFAVVLENDINPFIKLWTPALMLLPNLSIADVALFKPGTLPILLTPINNILIPDIHPPFKIPVMIVRQLSPQLVLIVTHQNNKLHVAVV